LFKADADIVSLLFKSNPETLLSLDEEHMTPLVRPCVNVFEMTFLLSCLLPNMSCFSCCQSSTTQHLAIEAEDGVVSEVINKLVKADARACAVRSLSNRITPLMLAIARKCEYNILKILIKAESKALTIVDKEGRIPLHVAAALKADAQTIRLLIKSFPDGVDAKDNSGYTPYDLAKKVKLKKDTRLLLRPVNHQLI
jgi:ankyrin repeat protein